MRINTGGELLIGTTTDSGNYLLQVNGNVYAAAYFESSDVRYKNIIATNPEKSLNIDVIQFTRKGDTDVRYGYSAQQILEVAPELVDASGSGWGVKYLDVHTLLINDLKKEVKQLKEKLKQNGIN